MERVQILLEGLAPLGKDQSSATSGKERRRGELLFLYSFCGESQTLVTCLETLEAKWLSKHNFSRQT